VAFGDPPAIVTIVNASFVFAGVGLLAGAQQASGWWSTVLVALGVLSLVFGLFAGLITGSWTQLLMRLLPRQPREGERRPSEPR
jgi:sorbitol-specific phosphotransferase system component IIC